MFSKESAQLARTSTSRRKYRRISGGVRSDKLAFVLTPRWLYLPMVKATGELREYMARSRESQAGGECFEPWEAHCLASSDPAVWHRGLVSYTRRWVEQHRGGGEDSWTVVRERETTAGETA